jgi:hypothetical protein
VRKQAINGKRVSNDFEDRAISHLENAVSSNDGLNPAIFVLYFLFIFRKIGTRVLELLMVKKILV